MRTEDGPRAWQILRRIPAYRAAWRRRRSLPGLPESAPFPVRLQTAADLAAARFGILAWEDPFTEEGPASPFWAVAPMLPAAPGPRATPLTADATGAGLSVAGLRLADGSLVLKLERGAAAVQFLLDPGCGLDPGGGVLARHDLLEEPRLFFARLGAAHALAAGEFPPQGGGRGTGTCTSQWTAWRRGRKCRRSRATSWARSDSRSWAGNPTATCAPGCAAWLRIPTHLTADSDSI